MTFTLPDTIDIKYGREAVLPDGFIVGHAQDEQAATGCTVIIHESGAVGAVSVRGAAPATIETDLLDPRNTVQKIHAVLLSGGSAFGLEAASGVREWLLKRGVGFEVSDVRVPLVCGASIFDLGVGSSETFPNKTMGYDACEAACTVVDTGNVGSGTGASVGKLLGDQLSMKSGFGCASISFQGLIVTALVSLNAVGNIFDRFCGKMIAGVIDPQSGSSIIDAYQALILMASATGQAPPFPSNTTIGCVITNGSLTKAQATHIADMTHDGYARAIEPVHTGFDGDTVFVLSSDSCPCSPDLIGTLAARVMEAAIHDAVRSVKGAYGLPSAFDLSENSA